MSEPGCPVAQSIPNAGAMTLAVARIHRTRSVEQLHRAGLNVALELMEADAMGLYVFDERMKPTALYAQGAAPEFLAEYEKVRWDDPMFRYLMANNGFVHSMALFDGENWQHHPLHRLMTRWGLDFSIEAPLTFNGAIRGTINVARRGQTYFSRKSLAAARFLCSEINVAFQRICEFEQLRKELASYATTAELPQLTPRTRQVARAAASGLCNREIAGQLGISENTVRTHLKQIYRILGVHTRAQLARRYYAGRRH